MNREEINEYVASLTGEPPELKLINDTLFIKFDFLPYVIREFVHASVSYDHSKMIHSERECGCGFAYFLDANLFYNIVNKFTPA